MIDAQGLFFKILPLEEEKEGELPKIGVFGFGREASPFSNHQLEVFFWKRQQEKEEEEKKYGLWKMEKGEESKRINGGMANSLEKGRRKTLRVSHKSHFLVFSTRMPQQHQPFPRKKNNKKKKGETARGAGF